MKKDTRPIKDRLLSSIRTEGDCWIWIGDKRGRYGAIRVHGRTYSRAHRISYEIHHGPIPKGMVVMHSCDNPLCVNPAHLSVGTQRDNVVDMHSKGRGANVSGQNNGRSKLTEDDVRAIKNRHVRYCRKNGAKQIARDYGVSKTVILQIISGKLWAHCK